jgi:hypothetical protein
MFTKANTRPDLMSIQINDDIIIMILKVFIRNRGSNKGVSIGR